MPSKILFHHCQTVFANTVLGAAICCHQVWWCSRDQTMAFLWVVQTLGSNDTSADLLFHGLDVDSLLQDAKCYFWTGLCEWQRISLHREKALNPDTVYRVASVSILVRVHLPRELQMKYPVIPGHTCGSAYRSLVVSKEKPKRNSPCITGFSNVCV